MIYNKPYRAILNKDTTRGSSNSKVRKGTQVRLLASRDQVLLVRIGTYGYPFQVGHQDIE